MFNHTKGMIGWDGEHCCEVQNTTQVDWCGKIQEYSSHVFNGHKLWTHPQLSSTVVYGKTFWRPYDSSLADIGVQYCTCCWCHKVAVIQLLHVSHGWSMVSLFAKGVAFFGQLSYGGLASVVMYFGSQCCSPSDCAFVFQNSVWQAKALARTTTELAAKVAHNPALETLWSHFLLLDFTKAMSASIELRHCICMVVWAFLLPFFLSLIDTLHSGNIRWQLQQVSRVFIRWDRSPVHYDMFTHQSHSFPNCRKEKSTGKPGV